MQVMISEPPKRLPKSPEDRPIGSGNACASCLYNIPAGAMSLTLPGFCLFIIGVVIELLVVFGKESTGVGMDTVALIFLIVGGGWSLLGFLYWIIMWVKNRPTHGHRKMFKRFNKNIQLVAVHSSSY